MSGYTVTISATFATIDEARDAAERAVRDGFGEPDGYVAAKGWPLLNVARGLPAEGGEVGPLPDGRVVVVAPNVGRR